MGPVQLESLWHRLAVEISAHWKDRLLPIIKSHESIFFGDKMVCGEDKGFVQNIHLTDDRPFRMPYRQIPPSQHAKLRTALIEMEEKGIICKLQWLCISPLLEKERWICTHSGDCQGHLPTATPVGCVSGSGWKCLLLHYGPDVYNVEEHLQDTQTQTSLLCLGCTNTTSSQSSHFHENEDVHFWRYFSSVLCYLVIWWFLQSESGSSAPWNGLLCVVPA